MRLPAGSPHPSHHDISHLNCHHARQVREVWSGRGDVKNLGRSWGSVKSKVLCFSRPAPNQWWGAVRRADGGVIRVKASFKWKIKEVNSSPSLWVKKACEPKEGR